MKEIPQWFGSAERPLFGNLAIPEGSFSKGGVLICPPLGRELIYTYGVLKQLGDQLCGLGFTVLRFHYDGTGHSAGTDSDSGRVAAWLSSIDKGIAFLSSTGVTNVTLVGMRAGALLAMKWLVGPGIDADGLLVEQTSKLEARVNALVLWDPVLDGKRFLRESRALHMVSNSTGGNGDGSVEAPGVVYSEETVRDLSAITVSDIEDGLSRKSPAIGVVTNPGRAASPRLEKFVALTDARLDIGLSLADIFSDSQFDYYQGTDLVGPMVTMVSSIAPVEQTSILVPKVQVTAVVDEAGNVVETIEHLGERPLFGISSRPAGGVPARQGAPKIIFWNVGRELCIGPARQWVELARRWSALGFECLRFDLTSIGDSPLPHDGWERTKSSLFEDVQVAGSEFVEDIHSGLVCVGLCSGSHISIELGAEWRPLGVMVVNPYMTASWAFGINVPREGENGDSKVGNPELHENEHDWSILAKGLVATANKVVAEKIAETLQSSRVQGLKGKMGYPLWRVLDFAGVKKLPSRRLEKLVEVGVATLIVAGPEEAAPLLERSRPQLERMTSTGRFKFVRIDEMDHSILKRRQREELCDVLTDYLVSTYG